MLTILAITFLVRNETEYSATYILAIHNVRSPFSSQPQAVMITYILWQIGKWLKATFRMETAYVHICVDIFKAVHNIVVSLGTLTGKVGLNKLYHWKGLMADLQLQRNVFENFQSQLITACT